MLDVDLNLIHFDVYFSQVLLELLLKELLLKLQLLIVDEYLLQFETKELPLFLFDVQLVLSFNLLYINLLQFAVVL